MEFWVDPRLHPNPPCVAAPRALAATHEDITDLLNACTHGRLYAVEQWILASKPLQAQTVHKGRRPSTPLLIAIETGQESLAVLLLANGYQLDLEPSTTFDAIFSTKDRSVPWLDLLTGWGLNLALIDPETVLGTYNPELYERFFAAGLDFTERHVLAIYLCHHISIKPIIGFTKRHRADHPKIQQDLNIALGHHVEKQNDKGVSLCLWAGADPHVAAPGYEDMHRDEPFSLSAIERAAWLATPEILTRLKPNPRVDDFDRAYRWAKTPQIIDTLHLIQPPSDWSPIINHHLTWISYGGTFHTSSISCLERIFELRGKLASLPDREYGSLRRSLLKLSEHDFRLVVRWLANPAYCEPMVFHEISRSQKFQSRLGRLRIGTASRRMSRNP